MIACYLVTDSYSVTPIMRITSGGQELAILEANEIRPSLLAAGRHATGQCGFRITQDIIPGLSKDTILELREALSDVAIYRRRPEGSVVKNGLFRLEAWHMRAAPLDDFLDGHFQLAFTAIDRLGRETTLQTFLLKSTQSIYVSARLLYKEYEFSVTDAFQKICILQDPFIELAETLIALKAETVDEAANKDLRERLTFEAAREYFLDVDLTNTDAVHRALTRLPETVEIALANPLARALASRTSDQTPNSSYISSALQSLASFDIVGVRECPASFIEPLAELVGQPPDIVPYSFASPSAKDLGDRLKSSRQVMSLIDMDKSIYETVYGAVNANF